MFANVPFWGLLRQFRPSPYILLPSLLFVSLELLVVLHAWVWILVPVVVGILAWGIILLRVEEGRGFHPVQAILPSLAAAGILGFSLFLPTTPARHAYALVGSVLFWGLLRHGARQAYPTWNWTIATLVFFLNVAIILGLQFYLQLPLLVAIVLVATVSFLVAWQALVRLTTAPHAALWALGMSLLLTQLTWVLQFLPLSFLTQAGVLLVAYYVTFHIVSKALERQLVWRDVIEYAVLGGVTLTILLSTARWV